MMLSFTDRRRKAALHVLEHTGLDKHPHLSLFISHGPGYTLIRFDRDELVPDEILNEIAAPCDYPYSNGERAVLAFLVMLGSAESAPFYVMDDPSADSTCRRAMGEGFSLAIGHVDEVLQVAS